MADAIISIIEGECAVYSSPDARAAYRAGMSTAAMICDQVAQSAKESNTTRGKLTMIGGELVRIAKVCGDEIMQARERVHVPPAAIDPEGEQND